MCNEGFAQITTPHIKGIVRHGISKAPLSGANVTIETLDGIQKDKTNTDQKGLFAIRTPLMGKYLIKVVFMGFEDFKDTIILEQPDKYVDISLKESAYGLNTVRITSQKAPSFLTFTKGKIILNLQDSPLAVGGSAYDVLLRAPGVNEQNETLTFRTKSVNVLINSRPSNLTGNELKNYLSTMPANQISKVEVIPNPSAKYDSNGGSVINIILKANERYGVNGSTNLTAGTGRYFKHSEGLNLNYGTQKLSLYTAYDYNTNKQYYENYSHTLLQENESLIQNSFELRKRAIQTFRAGLDYDISPQLKIGGQFRGFWNKGTRGVTDTTTNFTNAIVNREALTSTTSKVHISNPYVNGYIDLNIDSLGKKLLFNVDLFWQNKAWNDDINVYTVPLQHIRNSQPTNISTQAFSLDYTHPLLVGKLEAGLKFQLTTSKNNPFWEQEIDNIWMEDPTRSYNFLFKEKIFAAYINWNTIFFNKLDANFGLRTETMYFDADLHTQNQQNKRSFSYLFPTIGLEYELSDQNVLNANYRKNLDRFGFNVVNPFKNYINPFFSSVGNPEIKPQINHDMEISYTYKQAFVFGISYTKTLDVISPINISDAENKVISTFDNLPSSELFYLYANIPYRFTPWWSANFSGGYGFYKYNTISSNELMSNNTWSYLAQLETYFKLKRGLSIEISAFSRGAYASGIYKTRAVSTASIGVKKTFMDGRLILSAGVTDVFNTNINNKSMNYRGVIMDSRSKAETRFGTFGLTWNFGSKKKKEQNLKDDRINSFEKRI